MAVAAGRRAFTPLDLVIILIAVATFVRLVLAGAVGLGYDESYMVGNARTLALSYVDHPPLHVWLTWATVHLFGSEAPFVVRLPFVLLFAGSTLLIYGLTAGLYGARAGLWAAVALTLAPVFSLSDGSWVLPDGPAIFFLLASATVLVRILFDERGAATTAWLVAGALAGLAVLSKYNAAFFVLGVFVFLLSTSSARRHLATPGPWLAALAALVIFSPAIVWNAQHDLLGFAFQARRAGGTGLRLDTLAQMVGGQVAYLAPWLAIPFAISLFRALSRGPRAPRDWFLALAAIGPIVVFTLIALWSRGLPHWPMPGWLFAIPLFGRDAAALAATRPRFARAYMGEAAALFVALLAAFAWQARMGGFIPPALVAQKPSADPTIDLIDWTAAREAFMQLGILDGGTVFAAPSWLYAGKLGYALGPTPPVLCLCADPQQFRFRGDVRAWVGHDLIVVAPHSDPRAWERAATYFDSLQPLAPIEITRNGRPALTLDVKLGKSLHISTP